MAAPSANRFGRVSPTTAAHVRGRPRRRRRPRARRRAVPGRRGEHDRRLHRRPAAGAAPRRHPDRAHRRAPPRRAWRRPAGPSRAVGHARLALRAALPGSLLAESADHAAQRSPPRRPGRATRRRRRRPRRLRAHPVRRRCATPTRRGATVIVAVAAPAGRARPRDPRPADQGGGRPSRLSCSTHTSRTVLRLVDPCRRRVDPVCAGATIRLTVLPPASGTSSSRHQHGAGSVSTHSSTYGGSSTITSPIHEATTSSASNASAGSASIVNDGESCCDARGTGGGRHRRSPSAERARPRGRDGRAGRGRRRRHGRVPQRTPAGDVRRRRASNASFTRCIAAGSPDVAAEIGVQRRGRASTSDAQLVERRVAPDAEHGERIGRRLAHASNGTRRTARRGSGVALPAREARAVRVDSPTPPSASHASSNTSSSTGRRRTGPWRPTGRPSVMHADSATPSGIDEQRAQLAARRSGASRSARRRSRARARRAAGSGTPGRPTRPRSGSGRGSARRQTSTMTGTCSTWST